MAGARIDMALGARELTARLPNGDWAAVETSLAAAGADESAAAVHDLFARMDALLRGRLGGGDGKAPDERFRVRVALLPPWADARLLSLPRLEPDEIAPVLTRDAARHFLGSGRPLVVAGEQFRSGAGEGAVPTLAVASPRAVLDAVHRAADALGWELERVVPAHASWLRALPETERRLLIAVVGETAHMIRFAGPAPERIRRVPLADTAAVVEAAGEGPGQALILCGRDTREALAAALAGGGWAAVRAPEPELAERAAARHVEGAALELVPPALAWRRHERSRKLTLRMLAGAAAILVAAAAVHLVGTARALGSAQRERAELRAAVAPALAARDSLLFMTDRLAALRRLGGEAERWTYSLVEMAMLLPPETHLVALRAVGDTAVIEGEGGRAGDALAALRGATSLKDVRLEGTIQRDIEGGTTTSERFTLSAVLSPPEATAGGARAPKSVPEEGRP